MAEDDRISPFHISLYFSLFQFWNLNRFKNPISIARQETMRLSKIGSINTYIKCVKELDKWGYIKYYPSHNPLKGSLVNMCNFNNAKQHQYNNTITTIDNTTDNASDISNDKSYSKTTEKTTGKTDKQPVIPSINSINNINTINNLEIAPQQIEVNNLIIDNDEHKTITSDFGQVPKTKIKKPSKKIAQKKVSGVSKKSDATAQKQFSKPTSGEVSDYFTSKMCSALEAEKFYNYFESNGWLIGGKAPMKNWYAAANNWIMNIDNFKNHGKHKQESKSSNISDKTSLRAGKLHTGSIKNFSEPL
jgi:hypothetical protein